MSTIEESVMSEALKRIYAGKTPLGEAHWLPESTLFPAYVRADIYEDMRAALMEARDCGVPAEHGCITEAEALADIMSVLRAAIVEAEPPE